MRTDVDIRPAGRYTVIFAVSVGLPLLFGAPFSQSTLTVPFCAMAVVVAIIIAAITSSFVVVFILFPEFACKDTK